MKIGIVAVVGVCLWRRGERRAVVYTFEFAVNNSSQAKRLSFLQWQLDLSVLFQRD